MSAGYGPDAGVGRMDGLEIARADPILEVRIDRGAENRFTSGMTAALADAVAAAEGDPALRFVRLRSAGEVFCLGRDTEGRTPDELRSVSGRIVRLNEVLRESSLIAICEVQGDAAGFGVGLIASSDIAIAAEDARFWFPELEAGLAPTVVLSWLARLVPRKLAFELIATGRRITAAEALARALVTEVAPADGVAAAADRWIDRLATSDPAALRDVKLFLGRVGAIDERLVNRSAADLLALGSLRSQVPPS